jgi:hypothetical protein
LLYSFAGRLFFFRPGEEERANGSLRRLHLHHGAAAKALDRSGVVFKDLVIQVDLAPAGYAFDLHFHVLLKKLLTTPLTGVQE